MMLTRSGIHRIIQTHSSVFRCWRNRTNLLKPQTSTFYTVKSAEFSTRLRLSYKYQCSSSLLNEVNSFKLSSYNGKNNFFRRTFASSLFTPSTAGEHAPFIIKPEISFENIINNIKEIEEAVRLRNIDVDPQQVVSCLSHFYFENVYSH